MIVSVEEFRILTPVNKSVIIELPAQLLLEMIT